MQNVPFEKKIYLASPKMHGEELEWIKEAYETNWMSTVGANIEAVEEICTDVTHTGNAVALSSGTAALHMAVKIAGIEKGDIVFCSDLTFAASVNPVVYEGAIPVLIDSEYDTWNMDPVALKKGFEKYPDAKAVIVVHLYGTPAKMDEIRKICKEHDAVLIEDAAEALGASYKGRPAGGLGDIGVVSFNGNKIITGSTGGVLLTESKEQAQRAKKLSTQAREPVAWYQHEEIGYNYRMSNVVAGVVRGQFAHLEDHKADKRHIYDMYAESIKDLPVAMNPVEGTDFRSNCWLSCMLIEDGKDPKYILEKLAEINVEGRHIWKPMHMQPIYKDTEFISVNDRPVSEDLFERGMCLPSDINMTDDIQEVIIDVVRSCFK